MRSKLYSTSVSAISAMLEAVQGARRSIYWESYIFANDTISTHNFFDIFTEKAKSGVQVVIVLDGFGSSTLDEEDSERLRQAGVEILFFRHWFRRIHRKLLIVDEKTVFFGGVNVGRQYLKWLDLHVRLSGKIAASFIRSFAKSYALCGGTDEALREKQRLHEPSKFRGKLEIIEHWPIFNINALRATYETSIDRARERVTIISPYFIPHAWLKRTLRKAIARGVSVDVILPERTDPAIGDVANYINAKRYQNERLRFYFTPVMNHAKALLIDEREGIIGSQNIDALSFDRNIEMGAAFAYKHMVQNLVRIVAGWKKSARTLEELRFESRWYHPFLGWLIDVLHPVL